MEPTAFDTKPAPMNRWKRLIKIFTAPNEVFEAIMQKPTIWIPVLIVIVIQILSTLAMAGHLDEITLMTLKAKGMEESQARAIMDSTATIRKVSIYIGVVAAALLPVFKGGVTHVIAMLMGGKANANETLGVITHSYLIQMLGVLLAAPIIFFTGNPLFTFSAGVFMNSSDFGTPLYLVMNYLNVFLIWYLCVSVMGIKKIHGLSWVKSALAVLLPFIVMVGMTLAPYLKGNM